MIEVKTMTKIFKKKKTVSRLKVMMDQEEPFANMTVNRVEALLDLHLIWGM